MQGNVCLTWYTPQYIPICKCYFEIKLIYMFISKCLIFAGNHIICVWRFWQLWAVFEIQFHFLHQFHLGHFTSCFFRYSISILPYLSMLCLRRVKKLPINFKKLPIKTKMLITLKRHKQMLWFFCDNKRVTSTIYSFINFKIIRAFSTEIVVQS